MPLMKFQASLIRHGTKRKPRPGAAMMELDRQRRWKADMNEGAVSENVLAVYNLRFDDFGKRFDDFGKRFDDFAARMLVGSDRFILALVGLFVGGTYYSGNKSDSLKDHMDAKIDSLNANMNAKIDSLKDDGIKSNADTNAKIDSLQADMNAKIDSLKDMIEKSLRLRSDYQ